MLMLMNACLALAMKHTSLLSVCVPVMKVLTEDSFHAMDCSLFPSNLPGGTALC